MPEETSETREEQYLKLASYLKEHENEPELLIASKLTRNLKMSGRDVGPVKRMIQDGVIKYGDDGEPYFATPYIQAKREIVTQEKADEIADKAVLDITLQDIADQARTSTEQHLIIGKAVAQALFQWAAEHKITPQQLLQMRPHDVVRDALNKRDRYDGLVQQIQNLTGELEVYRKEADPVMRVKEACRLIMDFTKAASLAELAGFNVYDSGIVEHYQKLLNQYIKGG